jgi:hypothetical protein
LSSFPCTSIHFQEPGNRSENPDLQFIVILNQHNGPGKHSIPDETYSQEIPKLNAHPNVTTVGYVRVDYCKRNIKKVFDDVAKYAAWSAQPNLGVQGIFVDETPNLYSASRVSYLNTVSQQIKASAGLLGDRLVSFSFFMSEHLFLEQVSRAICVSKVNMYCFMGR